MHRLALIPAAAAAAAALFAPLATGQAAGVSAPTRVGYSIRLRQGEATAKVEMRLNGLSGDQVRVAMPVWKPGSYTVRTFARNVTELRARSPEGIELAVAQPDPSTWSIRTAGATELSIHYELDIRRTGIGRPARKETDSGSKRVYNAHHLEGPGTWLYVPGHVDVEHRVTFDVPGDWRVATGLERCGDGPTFKAPNYDVFADCPSHVGVFELLEFTAGGKPHEIALTGFERDDTDREDVVRRFQKIVDAHTAMWGELPYERYVFLVAFPGGSGLEHLNSTSISMMSLSGSRRGSNSIWDSLVSHEFFHLWNVKRLRPRALGPFDYADKEANRTRYLWVSEGFTSYFGDLLCVRSGLWGAERYWTRNIASEINSLQRNPGRLKESVADASWRVWDFPYMRRGFQAPDYYNKGQLLGLLLDVLIRDATENTKSLDDVMRALYAQCMTEARGFADGDVAKWCEKIAGHDFTQFFADYVDGTKELPFTEVLAKIGLRVTPPEPAYPGSRRRGRWRIEFVEDAPERAIAMREAMTQRTVK